MKLLCLQPIDERAIEFDFVDFIDFATENQHRARR